MKHRILGGLTVAVAMSVLGAPLPSSAQEGGDSRLSLESEAEHHADSLAADPGLPVGSIDDSPPAFEPVEPRVALPIPASDTATETVSDIATVHPHPLDNRQAATVYLRSIPVITVVGDTLETLSASSRPAASAPDSQLPLRRANEILSRLDALATDADVDAIEARWEEADEVFVVTWGDETLITLDEQVMLPDTTQNPGQDALHIANRLRRLLGDAPPLARIEGLPEPAPAAPQVGAVTSTLTGMASWYGPGFHGRRSASGEVFDQNALTAAHRTLPFGTRVRVTNVATGQSVVVRINDRGPFSHGRVIDLSAAAAANIGLRASGVGRVQVDVLSPQ